MFMNGASKLVSVGGDAVGFVGGAASKVGGAVKSTTSVVADRVGDAVVGTTSKVTGIA